MTPIRNPTLFEMEKLDEAGRLANSLEVQRPYSEPGLLLGTSAFTAAGWEGSFYPAGIKPRDFLSYYATHFKTVEVDSTFYRTPSASTVSGWYRKTPPDFVFAAKVPQVVTHEKVLVDCEAEFDEFVDRMNLLHEKLGPLLLQFPYFNRNALGAGEFLGRLRFFLKRIDRLPTCRFVVEIRNKTWLDKRFVDLLQEYNVALALTDQSWMPRPWEMNETFDPVTADFAYVRWLGDRKEIEEQTMVWDKAIVDRTPELLEWVEVFRKFVARNLKIFAYANNHYAGHGPATIARFLELWRNSD